MAESPQSPVNRIRQLRNKVIERLPAADKTLTKSGVSPSDPRFRRLAINIAGEALRDALTTSQEAEIRAETDKLTGLMVRQRFERRLEEEVNRAKRNKTRLTLLILDLNELKETNDGPGGHEAGDKLLKSFADSLRGVSRISDIISRYGGDEFYVLLPDTDINGGITYWEKLNKILSEKRIGVGAGISEIDTNDVKGSMERTDKAMYESKGLSKEKGLNILIRAGELQHV